MTYRQPDAPPPRVKIKPSMRERFLSGAAFFWAGGFVAAPTLAVVAALVVGVFIRQCAIDRGESYKIMCRRVCAGHGGETLEADDGGCSGAVAVKCVCLLPAGLDAGVRREPEVRCFDWQWQPCGRDER